MRAVGEWKVCSKCRVNKRLWDFSKYKSSSDGLHHYCKQCKDSYEQENKKNCISNIVIEGYKRCIKCGITKHVKEFSHESRKKDGRGSRCKECERLRINKYITRMLKTNPELYRERQKENNNVWYYKSEGWLIQKFQKQAKRQELGR